MRESKKNPGNRRWVVFGGALAAGLLFTAAFAQPDNGADAAPDVARQARVARLIAQRLPRIHLSRHAMDDTLAREALDLYLSSLDFDHTFFLAADVEAFKAEADQLDDQLQNGDVSFAFKVFRRFLERVRDRVEYVNVILDKGFDLSVDETYQWKRKDAPWPLDEAEWNDLWRRKIKNEYIARKVAVATADDEEKEAAAAPDRPDAGKPAEMESTVVKSPDALKDPELTPEDFIRKRYRQLMTLLEDSDHEYILDRYFNAFTQVYDPHTNYLSASRTEDFDINMSLSLVGIGALLSTEDGAVKVEQLIAGGPAERDGRIKPNDRIVAVAQGDEPSVDILHWPLYKVVRLIRGEKGSRVVLTVWPASDLSGATEKKIELVRDEVKLEERAAKSRIEEVPDAQGGKLRIAVITLPEFYADFKGKANGEEARSAARDMRKLVADAQAEGIDGMVLDLRNNGGGSLSDAIEIAGLFIEKGPIVQVKDRLWTRALVDPDPAVVYRGPLVVMVNRMSASASEIVAAALQDYGRALIVGDRKTHGKGTVQSLIPLEPGDDGAGSLKATTASFFRIAGGSTQLKGVTADLVMPSFFEFMEIGEEYLPHAMDWTMVPPARYAPWDSGWPQIDTLREQSEARRGKDPQFEARRKLLDRLEVRFNAQELPLQLDKRLQQAREEKELDKLQRELDEGAAEGEDLAKDPVLRETLQVLGDIIAGRQHAAPVAAAAAP